MSNQFDHVAKSLAQSVTRLLFEGNATGNTVGLVSTGLIKLEGRGPYEGTRLEIEFTEIGPGNTDTYSLKGALIPGPAN